MQRNPGNTYREAGTYSVSLTVTNSAGSNQKTATDYITVSSCSFQPVRVGGSYYDTVNAAYDAAPDGPEIEIQALIFNEAISISKSVTLKGGFTCNYSSSRIPETVINALAIDNGTVTVDGLTLQ
jgi:PKD repeat protein